MVTSDSILLSLQTFSTSKTNFTCFIFGFSTSKTNFTCFIFGFSTSKTKFTYFTQSPIFAITIVMFPGLVEPEKYLPYFPYLPYLRYLLLSGFLDWLSLRLSQSQSSHWQSHRRQERKKSAFL